jgi:two-component system sensor histidine kinase KdpD
MTISATQEPASTARGARAERAPQALAIRYGVVLLLVAAATLLAAVAQQVITAPNLTLIYVLPVVIAATAFGWGPALAAALVGVLCFDFFFTEPYFSFRIYGASDIWAAALLLATAAIVATVSAQARRRAVETRRAADQAEALQALAHIVVGKGRPGEIADAAAAALQRIFRAPVVIFRDGPGALRRVASAGPLEITPLDEEAARGAMAAQLHTRAETFPYDRAEFEFWPASTPSGRRFAIGVDFTQAAAERPEAPERFIEVVAAYLSAALEDAPRAQSPG